MLESFLTLLQQFSPLLDLLSTIAWGVYVYFTVMTFKEIKRQTELQSEAFLMVAAKKSTTEYHSTPTESLSLYEKWRRIIDNNVPNNIRAKRFLVLELTNKGKSDINAWRINVSASVQLSQMLQERFNLHGEDREWEVRSSGHRDIIAPGESIEVPIAALGTFPHIALRWTIKYTDIRKRNYEFFAGDERVDDSLPIPQDPSQIPET